jgi:hypothetical protein
LPDRIDEKQIDSIVKFIHETGGSLEQGAQIVAALQQFRSRRPV